MYDIFDNLEETCKKLANIFVQRLTLRLCKVKLRDQSENNSQRH